MPEICRFYGIIVKMYFNEHNPPYFYAEYGEYKVIIDLENDVINGFMPKRALKLLIEWMDLHYDELLENWDKCRNEKSPNKIDPLK
jgi:hypothetical protein